MRDPWRYRCPNGHTGWVSRSGQDAPVRAPKGEYYCLTCHQYGHGDPSFDELIDMKDPADRHVEDPEVTAV